MTFIQHNLGQITDQLEGILRAYANAVGQEVDEVVRRKTNDLRTYAVQGSPVETGRFRAGWQGPIKRGHAHYEVRNEIDYGPIIEFGGYRGVGPKTHPSGGETLPGGIPINAGIYTTPSAPMRRGLSKVYVEVEEALSKALRQ